MNKPNYLIPNPRFVWNIGQIATEFPDMEDVTGTVLWDRQEKHSVLRLHDKYRGLISLELAQPDEQPFTALAKWLNALTDAELTSEGVSPTKTPNVFEQAGFRLRVHNEWTKPDPRGPEYGRYAATNGVVGDLVVNHEGEDFTLRFASERSFLNWARACT